MYEYAKERSTVFTEEGVRNILRIGKVVREAIDYAGAVSTDKLIAVVGVSGDRFHLTACIDFLEECGEIKCCAKTGPRSEWVYF